MPTDEEIGRAYRERQSRAARAQKGRPTAAQVEARRINAAKATSARRNSRAVESQR